jgi:hypothetical protein
MSPRQPLVLASLLCQSVQSKAELPPQRYDYSYQLYQEDDERIRIEAHYLRGQVEIDDATSFRFQWLNDAISGSSPNGALPGGLQPFYSNLEDVRTGILGAISRQFGDHKVELEISRSEEEDYISRGFALSDTVELNQKNTTLSYGLNFLNDLVIVPALGERRKYSYDWFTGVSQIIDKDTVVSANLTLGFSEGYLNDQYKVVQRTDSVTIDDGMGGTIILPVDNLYRENRPENRFRQVLQFEARRYIAPADGVIDGILRLSHDDYGVFSQTVQIEWRQSIGENFQVIPFIRYYHQNAADFFVRSLDGLPIATPAADPDGSGINYSADYRLSSFNTLSGGVRLRYKFTDNLSASAAFERYVMSGMGSASDRSPEQAYASANIWTFGVSAEF